MNNYDMVAGFYDRLARIFFGKALISAQTALLSFIPADARILIAGGGTGWILEKITEIYPAGLTITYVELSVKMILLSKKRNYGQNKVNFMKGAIEQFDEAGKYDVVLTPFLFDNFSETAAGEVFSKLHGYLKTGGFWLYADFKLNSRSLWQRIILRLMYFFFRSLCRVEAERLPDTEACFKTSGYKKLSENTFYNRFIVSEVYRKEY